MKSAPRSYWLILLFLILALGGFWLVKDAGDSVTVAPAPRLAPPRKPVEESPARRKKVAERTETQDDRTAVQAFSSCRPNEIILKFPTAETFQSFASAISGRISLEARLDRLLAMRVGYESEKEMQDFLMEQNIRFYPSISAAADRGAPTLTSQSGSEPVGERVLSQLGITGDRSKWGAGVKIGIMDSGVIAHPALKNFKRSIAVVDFPEDLTTTNGHGTAVASLAAGSYGDAQGIAPAAEIVSIKVASEEGRSDALFMATGILSAVDEQVQVLNISMGQPTDNPLLKEAVEIAQQAGIVIVASSGNDGVSDASYPADYPGVISVGSVDGRGVHMGFSNFGKKLSLTAPGYNVTAAWPVGKFVYLSGTSASTPLVSGAIAAAMSDGSGRRLSARDAADAVIACADDAGIPGPDTEYGVGILNVGRVMRRNVSGVVDAAITDLRLVGTGQDGSRIEVSVQNQGTETLLNPQVEIYSPSGTMKVAQGSIAPGAWMVFSQPVYPSNWPGREYAISARVQVSNSGRDLTPGNNVRQGVFSPPP